MTDSTHNIARDKQFTAFQITRVEQLKTAAESATASYSSALGRLEANGLDKWAVKEALRIKKKGPSEVNAYVQKLKKLFDYLSAINLPVEDGQLDMFTVESAADPIDDRAYRAGVLTGAMGEGMEHNPHSPETAAGQAWIRGFHEGAANHQQFSLEAEEEDQAEVIPGEKDQTDIEDEE